jgi:3-polyprenyl-4-hydroxybenzoate decarboxylase
MPMQDHQIVNKVRFWCHLATAIEQRSQDHCKNAIAATWRRAAMDLAYVGNVLGSIAASDNDDAVRAMAREHLARIKRRNNVKGPGE